MTGYCPHHDPLLLAGSLRCGCGLVSYPVRAEWISSDLILAEFEDHGYARGCPARRGASVVLVDLDAESPEVPRVVRPRRCRGTALTTGRPCKSSARPGSAYCIWHDPDRQEAH